MITLDWDKITFEAAARRICKILADPHVASLELRGSPSCDGFHVYVEVFPEPLGMSQFLMRRKWGDDGKRICKDLLAIKDPKVRNVLFVYRSSPLGLLGEEPMIKYQRISNDKWRIWQTSPKNQLPTLLLDLPWLRESLKVSSAAKDSEKLTL